MKDETRRFGAELLCYARLQLTLLVKQPHRGIDALLVMLCVWMTSSRATHGMMICPVGVLWALFVPTLFDRQRWDRSRPGPRLKRSTMMWFELLVISGLYAFVASVAWSRGQAPSWLQIDAVVMVATIVANSFIRAPLSRVPLVAMVWVAATALLANETLSWRMAVVPVCVALGLLADRRKVVAGSSRGHMMHSEARAQPPFWAVANLFLWKKELWSLLAVCAFSAGVSLLSKQAPADAAPILLSVGLLTLRGHSHGPVVARLPVRRATALFATATMALVESLLVWLVMFSVLSLGVQTREGALLPIDAVLPLRYWPGLLILMVVSRTHLWLAEGRSANVQWLAVWLVMLVASVLTSVRLPEVPHIGWVMAALLVALYAVLTLAASNRTLRRLA